MKELRDLVERAGPPVFDTHEVTGMARIDLRREDRKGIPEVVFAEHKRLEQVLEITRAFLERRGRAIVSRARPSVARRLRDELPDYGIVYYELSRMVVAKRSEFLTPATGGSVGILTAGTADLPVAEEAKIIAEEMGCRVTLRADVGVAGLHRLVDPLTELVASAVDAIVVAAGMDGALPSVVAGLVDVPVIGLPTSVGYGLGGRGEAALLSMLQTCAPGLTVVNIDNGIGAGSTAALIANRVARARAGQAAVARTTDGGG